MEIVEDFSPLDMGITDIIMGIHWLKTLGATHINWKTHSMKFNMRNTVGEKSIFLIFIKTFRINLIQYIGIRNLENHTLTIQFGYFIELI